MQQRKSTVDSILMSMDGDGIDVASGDSLEAAAAALLAQSGSVGQQHSCTTCSRTFDAEKAVFALGQWFCHDHFRCSVCDMTPPDLAFFEHDGRVFCAEDYLDSEFGANLCAGCYTQLTTEDTPEHKAGGLSVGGRNYHHDCLRCTNCKNHLRHGAEDNIVTLQRRPFCGKCYDELYRRCPSCDEDPGEKGLFCCGKNWHSECFRCTVCSQPFPDNVYFGKDSGDGRGELPYCEEHLNELFAPKCYECLEPIVPPRGGNSADSKIVHAMGHTFHPECFHCTVCREPFRDGRYFEEGGAPYCEDHFLELFGEQCFACKNFIRGEVLDAIGHKWHLACFVCDGCGSGFDDLSYFARGQRAYCQDCYCSRFADTCPACKKYVIGDAVQIPDTSPGAQSRRGDGVPMQSWHPECLVCQSCGVGLNAGDDIRMNDGKPYCEKDYLALFSNRCARCDGLIPESVEFVTSAGGDKYHLECFGCHGCEKPLTGAYVNYTEQGDGEDQPARVREYCLDCHAVLHTSVCRFCGERIDVAAGQVSKTTGDGFDWHAECMACVFCSKPFGAGDKILKWKDLMVCEGCGASEFAQYCVACDKPIVTGQRRLKVMGSMYHEGHLTCVVCDVDVAGKPYKRDIVDRQRDDGDDKAAPVSHSWPVCGEHTRSELTEQAYARIEARLQTMQREETRKASHATTLETSLAQLALGEAKVRQAQEARDAIHAAIASRKRASSSANTAKPGLQDASHQEVAIEAGEAKQGAVAGGGEKLEAVDEAEDEQEAPQVKAEAEGEAEEEAGAETETEGALPLPEGWEELYTDDGDIYYHFIPDGTTVWDRPTA